MAAAARPARMNDGDARVFRPRYSLGLRIARLGLPIVFFSALTVAAALPIQLPGSIWLVLFAMGVITSLLPFLIVRDILLVERLVIRRFLLPETVLTHLEIESVDALGIVAGGRRIPLGRLKNHDDLAGAVKRWTAARTLKASGGRAPLAQWPYPARGIGGYASIWGIILGLISIVLQPAWLHVDSRWVMGVVFFCVYILFVYVLPRRFM